MYYHTIPKTFKPDFYRLLYKEHELKTDTELLIIYILEAKPYDISQLLPIDFNVDVYKELNTDLQKLTVEQAQLHFLKYSSIEKRLYNLNVPSDFSIEVYRYSNKDLQHLTDTDLKKHFLINGKNEKRIYKDVLYDEQFFKIYNNIQTDNFYGFKSYVEDITQIKSEKLLTLINKIPTEYFSKCIFLVNHLSTIQGASHYLYSLYNFLKRNNKIKIYLIDSYFNKDIFEKYNISKDDFLSYENDTTLLYYLCKKINPIKVYFNSFNVHYFRVCQKLNNSRYIIHSHETNNHFKVIQDDNVQITPTYVVSERIQSEYINHNTLPKIQPPLLTIDTLTVIDNEILKRSPSITNVNETLDTSKILIGMCGDFDIRKNYKLFCQLACEFSQYNFLWVGGNEDFTDLKIPNFFQILNVQLPYVYFNMLDYFILTSEVDPCPYVVLENIYIGNKVITFKENIYTNHKCDLLQDMYFEVAESINFNTAVSAINTYITNVKKTIKNPKGKDYILTNYTKYSDDLLKDLIPQTLSDVIPDICKLNV